MPLRMLRASDVPALASWLPAIASELGCDRWAGETALRDGVGAPDALLFSDHAGDAFIAYQTGTPSAGAATIDLVAVAHQQRRLGLGGRAALALERRLAREADRIYVRVPSRIGIALYFWLRLGYRPLLQHDWPAAAIDDDLSAWMMRGLR
jgi:ribosomal protein S18 acetylase RimI-like enzyme